MESPWQTYSVLQESLNKVNLINASLSFILTNGNRIQGLLGDFVFDQDNLFLELKDVTINDDKFDHFVLTGLEICRWQIQRLAPSLTNHQSNQSTFAQATFSENDTKRPAIYSSASNKLLIDQSLLQSTSLPNDQKKDDSILAKSNELSFRYKEIDLNKDDDYIAIDLSCLQLPACNQIELIQRKSVYSCEDMKLYYDRCSTIIESLKSEAMVGFAIFPQNDENLLNTYNNTVEYIHSLNRPLFMRNVLASLQYTYFCFSTADMNYAFLFTNISDDDEQINGKVFQLMKPLFESNETQKVVCGCTLMSGILWHKYRISLTNICDLQLIDRQIQKINIFHRKRPYNKYAPAPDVNRLRTCYVMINEYLTISLTQPQTVTNWTYFTTKVSNLIRMNIIFLRELSARMNYELMHYMFAYSNRALVSLRAATDKEVHVLTSQLSLHEYYRQLLDQPMFDPEKGIHFALNLNKVFPLRYYDPNIFIDED